MRHASLFRLLPRHDTYENMELRDTSLYNCDRDEKLQRLLRSIEHRGQDNKPKNTLLRDILDFH